MSNRQQRKIIQLPEDVLSKVRLGIIEDRKVKVTGLGIFETRKVKARRGRNPRTGEEIEIPGYVKVRFKATASLKKLV